MDINIIHLIVWITNLIKVQTGKKNVFVFTLRFLQFVVKKITRNLLLDILT